MQYHSFLGKFKWPKVWRHFSYNILQVAKLVVWEDVLMALLFLSHSITILLVAAEGFSLQLLFHRGLWGPWAVYIYTQGRNAINCVCTHKIFFLAQKLLSHCASSWPYGTDIHFSKYGRYLREKKKKKKRELLKKIWLWAENQTASGTPQKDWRTSYQKMELFWKTYFVFISSLSLDINTGPCGSLDEEKHFIIIQIQIHLV